MLWLWSELDDVHFAYCTGYRLLYLKAAQGSFAIEYESEKTGQIHPFFGSDYGDPQGLLTDFLSLRHRHYRRFAGIWTDYASFSTDTKYLPHKGMLAITIFCVGIPAGYWVGAAALLTAYTGLRWRRAHRPQAGTCAACGYDLRATPDRCPECGIVPAEVSVGVQS